MYNKLGSVYKRRLYNGDDGPPEKKLVSDSDIFIKQLGEKQRNTKVDLEQLYSKNRFYKSTEEVSITNYVSGFKCLDEFNSVVQHSNEMEKLKSFGLTNEEIELYLDFKQGEEHLKNKHRNLNEDVYKKQLENILGKIKAPKVVNKEKSSSRDRLTTELMLSAKPNSAATKLTKFALSNHQQSKEKLPGPMDLINDIEKQLQRDLSAPNVKKIRRKARSLLKKINTFERTLTPKSAAKQRDLEIGNRFTHQSQWDLREGVKEEKICAKEKQIYTCKPLNYYTIENRQIVKINPTRENRRKLTLDEIKKLPRFEKYEKGPPSRILYLKNIANKVDKSDLETIFGEFSEAVISLNVLKGRMQGQAFVEFTDVDSAEKALEQCNGVILRNKPLIIQFSRRKS